MVLAHSYRISLKFDWSQESSIGLQLLHAGRSGSAQAEINCTGITGAYMNEVIMCGKCSVPAPLFCLCSI